MRIPRDVRVERGEAAQGRHSHPWYYEAHFKNGTARSRKVRLLAYNKTDLTGQIIGRHARDHQNISIHSISRIMKYQIRSRREDV